MNLPLANLNRTGVRSTFIDHKGVVSVEVMGAHDAGPHRLVYIRGLPAHVMAARIRHNPLRITLYLDADATLGQALECTGLVLRNEERDAIRAEIGLPAWPNPIPGVTKDDPIWPDVAREIDRHLRSCAG